MRSVLRTLHVHVALIVVLLLAAPVLSGEGGDDADARLAEAWHALEIERKPALAAKRYRALLEDGSLSTSTRARATLGLARAERLLGRLDVAEALLREVLERYPELHVLQAEANAELPSALAGRTRFITGILGMSPGEGLDLDAGGVFPGRTTWLGGETEVWFGAEGLVLPTDAVEDPLLSRILAVTGREPWHRIQTDEGRTAWLQLLSGGSKPLVRFVTRVAGTRAPLGDVRDPHGLGREGRIEVWFEPRSELVRYRVEVRRSADDAFETRGEIPAPPFVHESPVPGTRYTYRITGFDAEGHANVPTLVAATTASRGVFAGTVELRRGQGVDLLSGQVLPKGGDLTLLSTYGGSSGAGFRDALGRPVSEARVDPSPPASLWDAVPATPHPYVSDGGQFLVPLRGGGVARGSLEMLPRSSGRDPDAAEVRIRYQVNPDGPVFPPPPRLEATRTDAGVVVTVSGLGAGFDVPRLEVRRPDADSVLRHVVYEPATRRYLDTLAGRDERGLLVYTAVPVGSGGRRGTPGSTIFDGRSPGVRVGTFQFHYHQGWAFARGEIVPRADADVFFTSCAGGISSVTLAAPGGITNLERVLERGAASHDPDLLMETVVGVDPERVRLDREAGGDSRLPASDVFVLRLRSGGWARLAIVHRGDEGGWTDHLITVRYAWNPHAPRFTEDESDLGVVEERRGIRFLPLEVVREHRRQAVLGHLPPVPRAGTFEFHYRQGWSFERGALADEGEADVVFETCAGGISSITLTAPGGIANLGRLLGRRDSRATREALLDDVVGVRPEAFHEMLGLHRARRTASGDSRVPLSDVFVLRTRHGGWVKMAIVRRGDEGGWTDHLATVRYVFNPAAPRFVEDAGEVVEEGPLILRAPAVLLPKKEETGSSANPRNAGAHPQAIPPGPGAPPAPWLAPYATEAATSEGFDRLRVQLLRSDDDAFVVRGLSFLAGAEDPYHRRLAASALGGAYLLGDQAGADPRPAIRRLARDPDAWTRYHLLAALRLFDTPLAREILAEHARGAIPTPAGEEWNRVRGEVKAQLLGRVDEAMDEILKQGEDEKAIHGWIAAAPDHPAAGETGRFIVHDLVENQPVQVRLGPANRLIDLEHPTIELTAMGCTVLHSDSSLRSADYAEVRTRLVRSGSGAGSHTILGSATPFSSGITGFGGLTIEDVMRCFGGDRVRVWLRVADRSAASRIPRPPR